MISHTVFDREAKVILTKTNAETTKKHFEAALKAEPTAIESHFHLVELYIQMGDESAALEVCQRKSCNVRALIQCLHRSWTERLCWLMK